MSTSGLYLPVGRCRSARSMASITPSMGRSQRDDLPGLPRLALHGGVLQRAARWWTRGTALPRSGTSSRRPGASPGMPVPTPASPWPQPPRPTATGLSRPPGSPCSILRSCSVNWLFFNTVSSFSACSLSCVWCLRRSSARNRFRSSWVNRLAGGGSGSGIGGWLCQRQPCRRRPSRHHLHPRNTTTRDETDTEIGTCEHSLTRMEQVADGPPIRFLAASDPAKVPVKESQDTRPSSFVTDARRPSLARKASRAARRRNSALG